MIYVIVYGGNKNDGAVKIIGHCDYKDQADRFCALLQEHSYGSYKVHESESWNGTDLC